MPLQPPLGGAAIAQSDCRPNRPAVPRSPLQVSPQRTAAPTPIGPVDLCRPIAVREPFTRDGWMFELKHDGFRAFARTGRTGVQLRSRWGRSGDSRWIHLQHRIGRPEHL